MELISLVQEVEHNVEVIRAAKGQAHRMFSQFLNLRISYTSFSLFFFSSRQKLSIETKNVDITVYHNRKSHFSDP